MIRQVINILISIGFILSLPFASCGATSASTVKEVAVKMESVDNIMYRSHAQSYGWLDWVNDSRTSGTSGESKRLEAIEIKLSSEIDGGIEYRTHVQGYGWMDWVKDGAVSGTTGEAKRIEAIRIRLTGNAADLYDVYYRTHVQSYGWLGWAKNGEKSGTAGYAKRMEAIEICVVPKGSSAPGMVSNTYINKDDADISYQTHIQSYGWSDWSEGGEMSGTSGESKRLESIAIKISSNISGNIEYRTHIQTYGWSGWSKNGALSGTTGEAKRLEAIQIKLTGDISNIYDVYYRVHAQSYGWLNWAKNGEYAGTAGLSKRLEAIEIVLVKKGGVPPVGTGKAFVEPEDKNAPGLPFDIAGLNTAKETKQIILAVGDGTLTGNTVYMFERGSDYTWRMLLKTPGFWGRNGASTHTIEGDMTTPLGVFDLGLAFGNKSNPGTELEWVDVNPYMYWVDDVNSKYYNLLIDNREVPNGWSSGEHLSEIVPDYNYSINIEVNPTCIRPGSTSAIFLHCGDHATAGCVSVPESYMVSILKSIKPGAKMIIAKNSSEVKNY